MSKGIVRAIRSRQRDLWMLLAVAAFAAVMLLATAGWYWVKLAFDEGLCPKKGTLEYYLKISSLIRDFPVIALVGEERYCSMCGGGGQLPGEEVSYYTEVTQEALIRQIDAYLVRKGFRKVRENATRDEFEYARGKERMTVELLDVQHPPIKVVATCYY